MIPKVTSFSGGPPSPSTLPTDGHWSLTDTVARVPANTNDLPQPSTSSTIPQHHSFRSGTWSLTSSMAASGKSATFPAVARDKKEETLGHPVPSPNHVYLPRQASPLGPSLFQPMPAPSTPTSSPGGSQSSFPHASPTSSTRTSSPLSSPSSSSLGTGTPNPWQSEGDETYVIQVKNLFPSVEDEHIYELFSNFGLIVETTLSPITPEANIVGREACITFRRKEDARRAIECRDGEVVRRRTLGVQWYRGLRKPARQAQWGSALGLGTSFSFN